MVDVLFLGATLANKKIKVQRRTLRARRQYVAHVGTMIVMRNDRLSNDVQVGGRAVFEKCCAFTPSMDDLPRFQRQWTTTSVPIR